MNYQDLNQICDNLDDYDDGLAEYELDTMEEYEEEEEELDTTTQCEHNDYINTTTEEITMTTRYEIEELDLTGFGDEYDEIGLDYDESQQQIDEILHNVTLGDL